MIEFAEDARQRAADECEAERREIEVLRRELAGAQGPLLDVGAGWGRMVSLYRELGLRSVCVEPDALGVCLMRRDGVHRVARAAGEALPFVAGAFSTLVLGWVVHHNSPKLDATRIMAQLRRVAAPGATLISIEPLSARFDETAWMELLEGAGFEVDHVERFYEMPVAGGRTSCYALARAIRRAEA